MTLGLSQRTDIPALKRLWGQAFGDGEALLGPFFSGLYRPEDTFVAREGEQVVSMAFQVPMTVCCQGRGWPAAYLYAVATEEAHRGQGLCGAVLDFAARVLKERGCKLLLLLPAEAGLRELYLHKGFDGFSRVDLQEEAAVPTPGGIEAVSAMGYWELREGLLAGYAYVSCPVPVLAFQETVSKLGGGGLYRIFDGRTEGCCCVARDRGGMAVIYELLWPGERRQGISLATRAVGASRALVRTPGDGKPFAMARWLVPAPELPPPYLGIALD